MELHLIATAIGSRFMCGRCGRLIPATSDAYKRKRDKRSWVDEVSDWLIYITDEEVLIVRCPQHITVRTLIATFGRTNERLRWMDEAAERDKDRLESITSPWLVPGELPNVD